MNTIYHPTDKRYSLYNMDSIVISSFVSTLARIEPLREKKVTVASGSVNPLSIFFVQ